MDKMHQNIAVFLLFLIALTLFLLYIEIRRVKPVISTKEGNNINLVKDRPKDKDKYYKKDKDKKPLKTRNFIKNRLKELEYEKAIKNYR